MKNLSRMNLNRDTLDIEAMRSERKKLLVAWDTMVANASFGTITITAERRAELIAWHTAILEKEKEAFENIPDEIAYYIGGAK